ncbi:Zinc/cadmium/lead-transporting P-type ATPase [Vibrio stylophorae]|uniref:P-type Zn(2+) transporter n=1 Tax=Vibrio stylophorae TaxID=659351 RepID=A0ABN8DQR3_9VIBR|nr:Zinc/cadmium/lead-transporting P-type ATPase [Vibrio stylophorae]
MCQHCHESRCQSVRHQQLPKVAQPLSIEDSAQTSCCAGGQCQSSKSQQSDDGSGEDEESARILSSSKSAPSLQLHALHLSHFRVAQTHSAHPISPDSSTDAEMHQHCDLSFATSANDESDAGIAQGAMSESWYIQGMDCPSCARKVENAVSRVAHVEKAKVLFATEKLVVQFADQKNLADVEQAIESAGFQYRRQGEQAKQVQMPWWKNRENWLMLGIAGLMATASVLEHFAHAASIVLFTVATLIGVLPIAHKAYQQIKTGTPFAIETLMVVAALGALYLGETAEAAMVLLLFLLGEKLEGFAANRARSGVQSLMALVPEKTIKIVDGARVEVAASELQVGDIIEVSAGERLCADGLLLDNLASVDLSALTGESIPVEKHQGEKIAAGALMVEKTVRIQVQSQQGENAIDRILNLIEQAEENKAPLERFIVRFSQWYTPLMMAIALLIIVIPPLAFGGAWDTWIYRGLVLLLIACPCALVISTPAAITSGLAVAAKRGALIKGGAALETLATIHTIAFDKTGTLTQGTPQVTDFVTLSGEKAQRIAQAASVEVGSHHPLAKAVVHYAKEQQVSVTEASDRQAMAGMGVAGIYQGEAVAVVAADRLPTDVTLSQDVSKQCADLQSEGKTLGVVLVENQPVALVAWRDQLRLDAKDALAALDKIGVHAFMLTGDHGQAAKAVAGQLGMDYQASLLPEDKLNWIAEKNKQGGVAMVGDGINDTPAMKTASIGIAMGAGSDIALETADAALTHNRLIELANMIVLSRKTLANIRQNVTIALGLKGLFLMTSVLGITGLWVAVLADTGATALVTLNALRLLRLKNKKLVD